MRIALITRSLGPGAGTAGYAARLRCALVVRGHEVDVVAPGEATAGASIALERVRGADLLRLGGGWHVDAMRAVGRWPGVRLPLSDELAVRTARVVVVNSRLVQRALHVRGIRTTVVRTGVDLARFRPGEGGEALLFVGHGWRRKNLRAAVAAAARLSRPLWVAGRDSRRRTRLRRARAVLGSRLVDLGPTIDPAAVFGQVAAVVHPTRYDPASNLVLEAMAAGVPVVSTRWDGSAELLPSELVIRNPLDDAEIARRIRTALAGGRDLGGTLRRVVSAWPDSRNARELESLIDRGWNG